MPEEPERQPSPPGGETDASPSESSSRWFRVARACALAALFLSALLYPLQVSENALERVLGSSLIRNEDVVDWPGLCSGIVESANRSGLWETLSPAGRRAVTEVAGGDEPTPERRARTLEGLNSLIQRRNLFRPEDIVSRSPELALALRDSLEGAPPGAREVRLLNRQLLQVAFPDTIADRYLFENLPGGSALVSLLSPYLKFELSPLSLKEVFASFAILLCLVFGGTGLLLARGGPNRSFPLELSLLLAFLAWALASMLRAPHFLLDSACYRTALSLTLWTLFALTLLRLPRSIRFERLAARCIVGVGLAVVALSAAQATRPFSTVVFKVMNDYAGPYQRNLFGSFIGHNTGVAVLALGPFFFLLGQFLTDRRRGRRILLGLALLLCLYCFAVTKSRFVWVALPGLIAAFLWALKSLTGARPSRRLVAGCLLLVLLAAGWRLAPLGGSEGDAVRADYLARIASLRPSVLLQGTRLRILAVSGSLVAQRPIAGHGLGAFASVYPAAQAEYFAGHPDTRLRPSAALTQRAHNDYLQLLVETGLVGLGLALAALLLFLRRGLAGLRRLESPEERLRRLSALFGMLSILLHATLDFPFHIAPLAVLFVFYCVLFRGSPAEDTPAPAFASRLAFLSRDSAFGRVGRLVLVLALWVSLPAGALLAARLLRADHQFKRGSNALQHGLVQDARAALSESLRLDPGHFEARLQLGTCEKTLAGGHYEASLEARKSGDAARARGHVAEAALALERAFGNLRAASLMARLAPPPEKLGPLGGRLNHALLDALAQAWDLRSRIKPDDPAAPARYLACRAEAARYAPGVADFLFELLDRSDPADPSTQETRRRYIRQLDRFNRDDASKTYRETATRLVQEEQPDAAGARLEEFLAHVPDPARYPSLHVALAKAQLAQGRLDAFRETLRLMRSRMPDDASLPFLDFIDLARSGEYEAAERLLKPVLDRQAPQDEYWQFAYAEALAAQGGEKAETARALSRDLLRRSANPSLSLTLRADVRRVVFGDIEGAADYCRRAIEYFPPFVSTQDSLALLRSQAARGDRAALRRTLHLVREGYAHSPALSALRDRLLGELAADPSSSRSAPK